MSNKELHRLAVIQAVIEKRLRRRDAASQLDLAERRVQRLMKRYRESGAIGLTNARRGKPGALSGLMISCAVRIDAAT